MGRRKTTKKRSAKKSTKNKTSYVGRGNGQYRDAFFKFVFGDEHRKQYALSLYNALNGTSYTDPSKLEFVTLKNVMFINYQNDVACLIDTSLNLWEEQTRWCPNMPLRFFEYIASAWSQYITKNHKVPSGQTKVYVPVPNCVVLYAGSEYENAEWSEWLHDAFLDNSVQHTETDLEVKVYNINTHKESNLIKNCNPLFEYSWMINEVKNNSELEDENGNSLSLTDSINKMISEIPENFELKELVVNSRNEVIDMLLTEFETSKREEYLKDTYHAEGMRPAKNTIALKLLAKGTSVEDTAEMTELPIEEVKSLFETIKK